MSVGTGLNNCCRMCAQPLERHSDKQLDICVANLETYEDNRRLAREVEQARQLKIRRLT